MSFFGAIATGFGFVVGATLGTAALCVGLGFFLRWLARPGD